MQQPGNARRLVKKIVVTYTLEGEGDQEYEYALTHEGDTGAAVNALVWDADLMERLRYADDDRPNGCRKPERKPGKGWKGKVTPKGGGNGGSGGNGGNGGEMTASAAGTQAAGECVWVHNPSCEWQMFCDWL
jgi:hypothetical protein